jgi:hypothetical protein
MLVRPHCLGRAPTMAPDLRAILHRVSAIVEELRKLVKFEDRHRELLARIGLVMAASVVVDVVGTIAVYFAERHAKGTEVSTLGDAFFFSTVQLLTVSSQIKNPLTTWGRVVDIALELWAVVVVAGSAGAIAAFFTRGKA